MEFFGSANPKKRNRLRDQAGNFWEVEKIFKVEITCLVGRLLTREAELLTIVGKENYLLFNKVKKLLADIAPLKGTRGDGMYIVSPVNTFTPGWDTFLSFFQ